MLSSGIALLALLGGCGGVTPAATSVAGGGPSVEMLEVGREVYARARVERRPIVLHLRAGWCHWCHVMEGTTYRDPEVIALLRARFVVMRAEADVRPDLAERYAAQGWPATVVFTPEGEEIVALRGYRPPRLFARILGAIAGDIDAGRAPGASLREGERLAAWVGAGRVRGTTTHADAGREPDLERVREAVVGQLDRLYDEREEGWGAPQKYPFAAPVEHALLRARLAPDAREREARALRTLAQHARLIDPIWGGMYQYSEAGVWDRPHYEKIAAVQAGAIDTFALAHLRDGDRRWLAHADDVVRYVRDRLRAPDGAFYGSQDADAPELAGAGFYALDDEERRAVRAPRVDQRVYASTNGQLAAALARLSTTADERAALEALALATTAAERVIATHLGADGLFAHAEDGSPIRHLADQAEMLRAMLALYEASAARVWIERARALADAILTALRAPGGGLHARTRDEALEGTLAERRLPVTENALVARALLSLSRLVDDARYRDEALAALRAVASIPALRALGRKVGEYAIALELATRELVVVHVVGPPGDARTLALRRAALAWDDPRRLVEVASPGQGRYPYPGAPVAFLCGASSCSMPISDPAALAGTGSTF